jgi:hypothetical protein
VVAYLLRLAGIPVPYNAMGMAVGEVVLLVVYSMGEC